MLRIAFLLGVAVATAAPAVAADAPAAQSEAQARTDKPQEKIVCRFVNSTGSRLSRQKECHTRAEWDRQADETADDIDRQRARATGDATNGPH